MKIWYQSGGSFRSPGFDVYAADLRDYLNKVARPGTEVSVNGVNVASPTIDRFMTEELFHGRQVLQNLLQAQQEGYDAFCVGNAFDPAFSALHEVAGIPICFLSEASMLLACLLSPNFTILCHDPSLLRRVVELVKRYGLQGRFIECDSFHVPMKEMLKAFQDPEVYLKPARRVAREAKAKGVCMLVNGEGLFNPIVAKNNIREIEGIPVLEGGGALIKIAEMLVDLKQMGVERSRLGLYSDMPGSDLAVLLKLYGVS